MEQGAARLHDYGQTGLQELWQNAETLRSEIRLLLFVRGDDAAAAMRTLPIALLEVGARVSDFFTAVLARYRDMLVFRHAARITESCLKCILVSAKGAKR